MSEESFDHRYASVERVHGIEKDLAVLKSEINNKLDAIKELIKEQRATPTGVDQFSLALQHFASKLPSPQGASSAPVPYRVVSAAIMCVCGVVIYGLMNGWH